MPPSDVATRITLEFQHHYWQQRFDEVTRLLNVTGSYNSDGFLRIDLSGLDIDVANNRPELQLQLRLLGLRDRLRTGQNQLQDLAAGGQTIHALGIEHAIAVSIVKLRSAFFGKEPEGDKPYTAAHIVTAGQASGHPRYQTACKELQEFFEKENIDGLKKELYRYFDNLTQGAQNINDTFLQLGARWKKASSDKLTPEQFKSDILKDDASKHAFIAYVCESLYGFYHERLSALKDHQEPPARVADGAANPKRKIVDKAFEIPIEDFYGTPEESLVLSWLMLNGEGAQAPLSVAAETSLEKQEKERQTLRYEFLFHLAGVYREYTGGSAACGFGTWARPIEFFHQRYPKVELTARVVDEAQVNKDMIERNYGAYLEQALKNPLFHPHLGALYLWDPYYPTPLQQAFIGAIKTAFVEIHRQHFPNLPQDYVLNSNDFGILDSVLPTSDNPDFFIEQLQQAILKIGNPLLSRPEGEIIQDIITNPHQYGTALHLLAQRLQLKRTEAQHTLREAIQEIAYNLQEENFSSADLNTAVKALQKELSTNQTLTTAEKDTLNALIQTNPQDNPALASQFKTVTNQLNQKLPVPTFDKVATLPPFFELLTSLEQQVFWKQLFQYKPFFKALCQNILSLKDNEPLQEALFDQDNVRSFTPFHDVTPYGLLPDNRHPANALIWSEPLLYRAVKRGHSLWVKALLKHNTIYVNLKNKYGDTPLHIACREGHTEVVAELLKHPKIDVNLKNENNPTPLDLACSNEHAQVVSELLKHPKIDVNLKDKYGDTPLSFTCWNGNAQVVAELLKHPKINVNLQNKIGDTPLHEACREGHTEVVAELLNHNTIDVNLKNGDGKTPLDIALTKDHTAIVELFAQTISDFKKMALPLTADPNIPDNVKEILLKASEPKHEVREVNPEVVLESAANTLTPHYQAAATQPVIDATTPGQPSSPTRPRPSN